MLPFYIYEHLLTVLWIRKRIRILRIRIFLGLTDPHPYPLDRSTNHRIFSLNASAAEKFLCCHSKLISAYHHFFWAFRIRIRLSQVRVRLLPSSSQTSKKNLDFYCLVTSLWLLFKQCSGSVESVFFGASDPHPDPLDRDTDPRFRIDTYQHVTDTQHCLPTIIWYL